MVDKDKFGYKDDIKRYLQDDEKSIPKGSFTILKKSGRLYWYYNLSKGSNRLIHLCSVEEKGNERNSFLHSVNILKEKLKEGYVRKKKTFIDIIDSYISKLRKEGNSNKRGTERTKKTVQDIISHLNKFRSFIDKNDIKISDVGKIHFRNYISDYVSYLLDKEYEPNTIRVNITHVKQFLDELIEPSNGKPIVSKHHITSKFLKSEFSINKQRTVSPNFYSKDIYLKLVKLCNKEVRKVWREWIKGDNKNPDRSTVVYFTSLLQLIYGFRIGEIVRCYSSYEMKEKYHDDKSGFSYIEKDKESQSYFFEIYFKRKRGRVFVDYPIYSWVEPPKGVEYNSKKSDKERNITYETNIVDIIKLLYSNEKYLISTDQSTFYKYFDKELYKEHKIKKWKINGSHDFRDLCINYLLHTKKVPIIDVSELTRHDVRTLEKHYLHHSKDLSREKSRELNMKNRLSELNTLQKNK